MKIADLMAKVLRQRESVRSPLRIVQAGHPALRASARPLPSRIPTDLVHEFVEAMVLTMHEAPGVGLAAPQVGVPVRLVVMHDAVEGDEDHDDPYERSPLDLVALANPTYEELESERRVIVGWEGCLSVDGWRCLVTRPRQVRVRGTIVENGALTMSLDEVWSGWKARIFQHEIDHLNGVLCHDRSEPRSLVHESYQPYYTELTDAVRYLGLRGEVSTLPQGEVGLDR